MPGRADITGENRGETELSDGDELGRCLRVVVVGYNTTGWVIANEIGYLEEVDEVLVAHSKTTGAFLASEGTTRNSEIRWFDPDDWEGLSKAFDGIGIVVNNSDPKDDLKIMQGALEAGAYYIDPGAAGKDPDIGTYGILQ